MNIGSPREISILQCAEKVVALAKSKSRIVKTPYPPEFRDDPKVRKPDISRAKALLGWEPRHAFDDSLIETLEYFKTIVRG